jgi:hypothetical protein
MLDPRIVATSVKRFLAGERLCGGEDGETAAAWGTVPRVGIPQVGPARQPPPDGQPGLSIPFVYEMNYDAEEREPARHETRSVHLSRAVGRRVFRCSLESGPCRDRTYDLGIKSPLLYQLS